MVVTFELEILSQKVVVTFADFNFSMRETDVNWKKLNDLIEEWASGSAKFHSLKVKSIRMKVVGRNRRTPPANAETFQDFRIIDMFTLWDRLQTIVKLPKSPLQNWFFRLNMFR